MRRHPPTDTHAARGRRVLALPLAIGLVAMVGAGAWRCLYGGF